jgi:hypothetical protein
MVTLLPYTAFVANRKGLDFVHYFYMFTKNERYENCPGLLKEGGFQLVRRQGIHNGQDWIMNGAQIQFLIIVLYLHQWCAKSLPL